MNCFDLVIIGGGLAGTALLCELLQRLPPASRARIATVDRWGEFGGGTAYGRHTDPGLLLTNDLQELALPEFNRWLEQHDCLDQLPHSPTLEQWQRYYAEHATELTQRHLPRALFGRFLRQQLRDVVGGKPKHLSLYWLRARALLAPDTKGWQVRLANGRSLPSRHVVLALGSPAPAPRPTLQRCWRYLHDWQGWGKWRLQYWLQQRLRHCPPGKRWIIVAGANASAVELVYWMTHTSALDRQVDGYLLLAPDVRLPDGGRSGRRPDYRSRHLVVPLASVDELLAALAADIETARSDGYTTLDALDACRQLFNCALHGLPSEQQRHFVQHCGPAYKALTRRLPEPYATTLVALEASGRLRLLRGRLDHHSQLQDDGTTLRLANYDVEGAVLINATGSGPPAGDPLLQPLLATGQLHLNPSRQGLAVDDDFAASDRLYGLGPLLAGFSNGQEHIWHLENIPRLMALARRLAARLAVRLAR